MDKFLRFLRWVLFALFFLSTLVSLFKWEVWRALPWLICTILLFPKVDGWTIKKFGFFIEWKLRSLVIVVLLVFSSSNMQKENQNRDIAFYSSNAQQINKEIQNLIDTKKYDEAYQLASKYTVTKNTQLLILHEKAKLLKDSQEQALDLENKQTKSTQAEGLIWQNQTQVDTISNKDYYLTYTYSTDTFNLDHPYRGSQKAILNVRRHPRYGLDVFVQVEKGQLYCPGFDCYMSVRFDNRPAMRFEVNHPEDSSSETWFISRAKTFVKELKNSKKVYIELKFYRNGNRVVEFNAEGFNLP